MNALTKSIFPIFLSASVYSFAAKTEGVSMNLETLAKAPCVNGAAGPAVLLKDPGLATRIEAAIDTHPENPLGEVFQTPANSQMDVQGNITVTYNGVAITIGTLNYDEFNEYCSTHPKEPSIQNRIAVKISTDVRVVASRKVGECVRAGVFHPEQYRYIDYTISIQAGSQSMTLTPEMYGRPKYFMLFASKSECEQWRSTWSEVEAH